MTFKIGKKSQIILIILVILVVIYNILFFVIPWRREVSEASFWITYVFTWLAFLFLGVTIKLSFNKKELKSKIFGIPINFVGVTAILLQLILDLVVMCVGSFYEIWWWIPTITEFIIFGLCVIVVIIRYQYRGFIEEVDNKKINKSFMEQLNIKINLLIELNKSVEIKNDLENLAEKIKYSDPVSYKAVADIENLITTSLEELEKAVVDKNINKSKILIDAINRLLNERKMVLKNVR